MRVTKTHRRLAGGSSLAGFAITAVFGLAAACGAAVAGPPYTPVDAGNPPVCPVGPNAPTASTATLPSGACTSSEGPCNYEATPCPSVKNGTVNGYTCTCASGSWDCEIVNQDGLCSPIPEGGVEDADLFPDAAPGPDGNGYVGPSGPTGPAQP
jgi:hypothetical protein